MQLHLKTKVEWLQRLIKCAIPLIPFLPYYSIKHTFILHVKAISLLHIQHTFGMNSV
jgi:hypothetical protein